MYEARQNKEKVSRTIVGGGMARQRVELENIGQRPMIQRKDVKFHSSVLQKVRVATNVVCPSWGNTRSLGSYIHGLFETRFLTGGGGAIAMAAPPAANRTVEQQNPMGGFSDFAQFIPGLGMGYAELKPNTQPNINLGAAQLGGLNPIVGLALPGIPLNAIDPNAQPQPQAGMPQIYHAVPGRGPAPIPGVMPSIHFAVTGTAGLYVYDAW